MRISDWSSDVCSSDLPHAIGLPLDPRPPLGQRERLQRLHNEIEEQLGDQCWLTAVQKLYRHVHAIVEIDLLPRLRGIVDRLVGEAALRHELDLDGAAHRAPGPRMPFTAPLALSERSEKRR